MIVGNRAKRLSFSKFDLASTSEQTQDRDSVRRKDQRCQWQSPRALRQILVRASRSVHPVRHKPSYLRG
jgi:hypothetical protein